MSPDAFAADAGRGAFVVAIDEGRGFRAVERMGDVIRCDID